MNFKLTNHRDDVLFVIALLLPAVFACARYVQSDREMTRIAQARAQAELAAARNQANLRLAYAESGRR